MAWDGHGGGCGWASVRCTGGSGWVLLEVSGVTVLEPHAKDLVREEIADLEAFLQRLPGGLTGSAAFLGYWHRLRALRDDLQDAQPVADVPDPDRRRLDSLAEPAPGDRRPAK
jgi:hypothetical protein